MNWITDQTRVNDEADKALTPQNSEAAKTESQQVVQDGQHDFDFYFGTWKQHLKRLMNPLTGSTTWVEFDGTIVTRKVWDGRANLNEFEGEGTTGSHRRPDPASIQPPNSPVEPLLGQQQGWYFKSPTQCR